MDVCSFSSRRPSPDTGSQAPVAPQPPPPEGGRSAASWASAFADRWLLLEHVGGAMPGPRAAALVSRALRTALMSGYSRAGLATAIPTVVSGHEADGLPTPEPHLAIVSLARAEQRRQLAGFALIPPAGRELLGDDHFRCAVRAIAPPHSSEGRGELRLVCGGFDLTFAVSEDGSGCAPAPAAYVAAATTWATCTPVVLDRHLKAKDSAAREAEVERLMRRACRNVGLPEPVRVVAGRQSALAGVLSVGATARSAYRGGWRRPQSLDSRPLTHAVVQFAQPVHGPVLLGAGRFVGLGLCRALDPETGRDG